MRQGMILIRRTQPKSLGNPSHAQFTLGFKILWESNAVMDLTGGRAQMVIWAMGTGCKYRSFTAHSLDTHLLLCGRVPNRPKSSIGPWPQGVGTPVLENTRSREWRRGSVRRSNVLEWVVMRRKEVRAEEALYAHAHMCMHRIGTAMKLKGLPKIRSRTFKGRVQKWGHKDKQKSDHAKPFEPW